MNKAKVIKTSFFDQKNYIQTEEEKNLCYVRDENSFWLDVRKADVDLSDMFSYMNDDVLYEGYLNKKKKSKNTATHYYRYCLK